MRPKTKQVKNDTKKFALKKKVYGIQESTKAQRGLGPEASKGGARLGLTVRGAAGFRWAGAGCRHWVSVAWSAAL